jgi:hypothetical protein
MKPIPTMRTLTMLGCTFGFSSLCGSVARADAGDHIRIGEAEVVPSVELRAVRRSNLYLSEGSATDADGVQVGAQEQSGTALSLRPSVTVALDGEVTSLHFNLDYQAVKYLESQHKNLDRYRDVETGLVLNTFKESVVGVKLAQRFHITGRETEATYSTSAYINHLMNSSSGRISIRPGSSLEIDLGGNYNFDKYDVSGDADTEGSPALNSRTAYGPGVDIKWAFFPKTAIIGSYSHTWFTWDNNLVDTKGDGITTGEYGETLGIPNGTEWRATLGLRGRLTEKIVLGLIGGYGQMNYDEDSVPATAQPSETYHKDLKGFPDGLLSIVELGYHASEVQSLTLGYRKAFQDVYFSNFVDFHNVFLRYEGLFADKVGTKASVGYRYEQYVGEVSRDDHLINLGLDMSYRATKFLDVGAGVKWQQRGSADGDHSDIEYDDLTISLGLTATY